MPEEKGIDLHHNGKTLSRRLSSLRRYRSRTFLSLILQTFLGLLLVIFVPEAFPAQIHLALDAPTTNEDGSPLTDLAGYKIYYGTAPGSYGPPLDVGNVTTYYLTGLTAGTTYYIAATAYDSDRNESVKSNEVSGAPAAPTQYTLTANAGPGGSVAKNPNNATYDSGTQVTLTATASSGYSFSNWSGDVTGTTNPVVVTMDGNKNVTANFTLNQPAQYTLTVNVSPSGGGSVAKNPDTATYASGTQVTLTASANSGYTFSSWSGGATGTTNPITVTMDANKTVTATFTPTYTLTVNVSPAGGGSVTANPNNATYASGTQVTLTASANSGYTFSSWSGDVTGATNPATLTMNGNKIVTATFTPVYTLTVNVSPSGGGSVAKNPNNATYASGTQVTLTATANSGYLFSGWSGDVTGATNPATLTMNGTKTVTATFAPLYTLTVNVSPSGGGSVTANPNNATYVSGAQVTLTATANSGYVFTGWSGGATGAANPITVTMDANKTVSATFAPTYTLTVPVSPSGGGSVTKNPNNTSYASGTQVTLTATANSGYIFAGWSGGVTGTTNPITVTVDADKTVTATFTPTYTLTVAASPSGGGSVSKNPNNASYASGTQVILTATANSGYIFAGWSGGATGATNPITVTMDANKTVTATFTQNPPQYTLTVTISPTAGGSVTKSPDKPIYNSGDTVTLTATASSGYAFSGWSGGATGTTNPVTLTMNANKTVTATFTPTYTLSVNISPSAGGSVTANPNKATYNSGETVTITATANSGYTFGGWSGGATGTTNPVVLTMNANKTVTATFTPIYTLTVNISPALGGSVTKNPSKTTYNSGETVTLTATANSGYTFTSWSGDGTGTSSPITVTMNGNKTVTATFTQNPKAQYALTVTVSPSAGGSVNANPSKVSYNSGETVTLTATANPGYIFSGWTQDGTGMTSPITLTMNSDKAVTATFTAIYVLTVNISPAAGGSVIANPSKTTYSSGETVTLTATASSGYIFRGWSGGVTGTANPATVTMNGNKTVTATFAPFYTLAVNINPAAGGSVTANPSKAAYNSGEMVTLTAVAGSGYTFNGWSGDVVGSTNPIYVTMNASKNITAQFTGSQATFQLSCPDSGIQCLERPDGASDIDNLVNGKPKVDVEFQFRVVVQDSGGTPRSVKLFMTQRRSPVDPNDFYDYEMSCGGDYTGGANCTYGTVLGPAAVHKFYFQAQMSDGSTVKRYPSTGFITGPEIYLLEGSNHIGIPRDVDSANLDGLQAVGSSRVYRWQAAAESYTAVSSAAPVRAGEGYSIYRENDTLPELESYPDVAGLERTLPLSPGANLISNPFCGNVKLADVQVQKGSQTPVSWSVAVANGWVVNALYYYNGKDWGNTYSHVTLEDGAVLVPWLGYWVDLNMTDDTYILIIPGP